MLTRRVGKVLKITESLMPAKQCWIHRNIKFEWVDIILTSMQNIIYFIYLEKVRVLWRTRRTWLLVKLYNMKYKVLLGVC